MVKYKELVHTFSFFLIGISISESISGQRIAFIAKNVFGPICKCAACGFI